MNGWNLSSLHVWLTDHRAFLFLMTIIWVLSWSMQNVSNDASHLWKQLIFNSSKWIFYTFYLLFFLIALYFLGRMPEDIPGAYGLRQGRVHPWISDQINAELCVSICEFTTLLETTSGVFWWCPGTSPCYQKTSQTLSTMELELNPLRFSAQSPTISIIST